MAKLEICSKCRFEKESEYGCRCSKCLTSTEHDGFVPKTNDDRINAMTPEEKAEFFGNNPVDKMAREWCEKLCPNRTAEECDCPYTEQDAILEYLKAEVKE